MNKNRLKDYLYMKGIVLCAAEKIREGNLKDAEELLKMRYNYYYKLYSKMSKKDLEILLRIENIQVE